MNKTLLITLGILLGLIVLQGDLGLLIKLVASGLAVYAISTLITIIVKGANT